MNSPDYTVHNHISYGNLSRIGFSSCLTLNNCLQEQIAKDEQALIDEKDALDVLREEALKKKEEISGMVTPAKIVCSDRLPPKPYWEIPRFLHGS